MERPTTRLSKRLRARVGALLIAGSTALALVVVPGGGLAQEEPEPEKVEVTKDALFAKPAGNAAPNTLTSEFPPGVVCLVVVQFCTEQAEPITGPVDDALTGADLDDDGEADTPPVEDTPDDQSPQQGRAPDTITVMQNSGEDRYAGALAFKVPPTPDGQEFSSATLILHEVRPTYHTSSPFFRQMMLAMLAGVRDQEAAQEEAEKAIMGLHPQEGAYPAAEAEVGNVGVEVCPFTEPFEEGAHRWADTPEFDCIFGANGVREEVEGGFRWTFDLTFTLNAWDAGTLPNHGLYVRATRAPNLAFGDPDTSWQAQISFGSAGHDASPELAITTVQAASSGGGGFPPAPANDNASSGGNSGVSQGGQGSGFPAPQAFPSSGSSGGAGAPVGEPTPVTAPAEPQAAPQPVAATSNPVTPWWVWLLVPTFLAGMFLTGQSLTTGVETAVVREGAMSRLIQQRRGGQGATATPQFQV